jgi:hypothetical protein
LGDEHITLLCPNKRVIVMREQKEIEFEKEKSEEDEMSPLKDCSDVKNLVDGEILMIRTSLNFLIKHDDVE